ncbi:MAG: FkbM family methyltransferase [Prevotella sp.]|jgi:hypothetical protein|nr:FkbM family methyltransferase [Prevotella sp.]
MIFEKIASLGDIFSYKRVKRRRKAEPHKFDESPRWELRKRIVQYYQNKKIEDKSLKDAFKYIRSEGMAVFPYYFRENYNRRKVTVYQDEASGMKYVKYKEKDLYFPVDMTDMDVQGAYAALLVEQDRQSAHRYLTDTFDVNEDDILLDVGAAEGILSLDVVEKVKKIFLFEVEERWIKALNKTFEPWKDKITIVNKYVSNVNDDNSITLDSLIKSFGEGSIFLKLDVEGAEEKALEGAKELLTSGEYKCKAAICTYHKQNDYEVLSKKMKDMSYEVETSDGYMLFVHDPNLDEPYFRHALIRCRKKD